MNMIFGIALVIYVGVEIYKRGVDKCEKPDCNNCPFPKCKKR